MGKLRLLVIGLGLVVGLAIPATALGQEAEQEAEPATDTTAAETQATSDVVDEATVETADATDSETAAATAAEPEAEPAAEESAVDDTEASEPAGATQAAAAADAANGPAGEPVGEKIDSQVVDDVLIETTAGGPADEPFTTDPAIGEDSDGKNAVLYGTGPNADETSVWDGYSQTWTTIPGANDPGPRYGSAMAAPPASAGSGLTFLSGGNPDGGLTCGDLLPGDPCYSDTWIFSQQTNTWTPGCVDCAPGPITNHTAASNSEWALLFGGWRTDLMNWSNELWYWDVAASDWVLAPIASSAVPGIRQDAELVYDGKQFVLFGGISGDTTEVLDDTWTLVPTAGGWIWTEIATPVAPEPRFNMGFGGFYSYWDPWAEAILVGGLTYEGPLLDADETYVLSDAWIWDGKSYTWTLADPGLDPVPLSSPTALQVEGVPYQPLLASLPYYDAVVNTAVFWDAELGDWVRITQQWSMVKPEAEGSTGAGIAREAFVASTSALPFTGSPTIGLVLVAISLIGLGALAVTGRRLVLREADRVS